MWSPTICTLTSHPGNSRAPWVWDPVWAQRRETPSRLGVCTWGRLPGLKALEMGVGEHIVAGCWGGLRWPGTVIRSGNVEGRSATAWPAPTSACRLEEQPLRPGSGFGFDLLVEDESRLDYRSTHPSIHPFFQPETVEPLLWAKP